MLRTLPKAILLTVVCASAPLFVLSLSQVRAQEAPDTPDDIGSREPDPDPDTSSGSVDDLRQEYERLREQLFTSRARSAAVGSALYNSQLQVFLSYRSGRFHNVRRATIRLDGANIYDDKNGKVSQNSAPRFQNFIAPGRHNLTVRIETQAKDDGRFVTTTESTFFFDAPQKKQLIITVRAQDGGNAAYAWKKKSKGTYRIHLDVDMVAKAIGPAK